MGQTFRREKYGLPSTLIEPPNTDLVHLSPMSYFYLSLPDFTSLLLLSNAFSLSFFLSLSRRLLVVRLFLQPISSEVQSVAQVDVSDSAMTKRKLVSQN